MKLELVLQLLLCCVLASTRIIHAASAASRRSLQGVDAWATAPRCTAPPTTAATKDALGRLWGWLPANKTSCAFKDEQQQPLSPGRLTALQAWDSAAPCPEAPSADNSAPDSLERLWGVSWGRCVGVQSGAS